jgi:ribosomal protein S27AE
MTLRTTQMIGQATIWLTSEFCPDCGTALTVADGGGSSARAECRSCGYADTWITDQAAGGGR